MRYADFRTVTRDKTLASPVIEAQSILRTARDCLKRVPLDRKLRLLGIRISALSRHDAEGWGDAQRSAAAENLRLFD